MNPEYVVRRLSQEASVAINSVPSNNIRIFTKQQKGGWGRDWFFMGGTHWEDRGFLWWRTQVQCGRIAGHQSPLPRIGDEFHCELRSHKVGRFVVVKVDYPIDPPDQFFADVEMRGYAR